PEPLPLGMMDGASFALDAPDVPPAVWGSAQQVLWARHAPLLVTGPDRTGKTTLGIWLAFGLLGIVPEVLGFPVEPAEGPVAYLALDRPAQIRRRMHQI